MSAPTYDEAVTNMHSSANAVSNLQRDVTQLAPLAQTYHSLPTPTDNYAPYKEPSQPDQGAVMNFLHFAGGVAAGIGNIAGTAAGWVADQTKSLVTAPIRYGIAEGSGIVDNLNLTSIDGRRQQLEGRMQTLQTQYKAGQISKDQYARQLNDLSQDYDNLSSQSRSLTKRFANDYEAAKQATIDTSALLLTLGVGFGGGTTTNITTSGLVSAQAQTAGDWLASLAAKSFFSGTEDALRTIAAQPEVYNLLTTGARQAVEDSVASVVATGAKMSAAQIARASAVNLALKYPLTYWYTQSTATDLYHELDQAKYGDAIRTAAINAAFILSGGPIGYALKWGGNTVKAAAARVFTRSSFLDELSKGIGQGSADGLWQEISNIKHPEQFKFYQDGKLVSLPPEEAQQRIAANLSALEATNMAATGKDPVAAAWRVLKGMANYEGVSMKDFTPEEALINMNNFAEAQRAADEAGKAAGERITVGRVDARDLDEIAAGVTASDKAAVGAPAAGGATIEVPPNADEKTIAYLRSEADKLPSGYKVTAGGNDTGVFAPDGHELNTGELQDLTQAPYLTEFEHASKVGDTATMERIAREHPGDNRVNMGSIQGKEPALQSLTQNIESLPSMSADAKTQLLARARQQATSMTETTSAIDQRLQAWEQLKASNPNKAWAHNENFDRQMKALIQKYDDPTELDNAIRKIQASYRIEGLPKQLTDTLSQMGYLPIKPVNLEAPFTEGTGKVVSAFAKANSDIFTRAVQPVPILSWLGGAISKAGLSPYASSERVYQLFNDNLAKNLQASGIIREIQGESLTETTDSMIKQLSSYMHSPTAGKLLSHAPVTDLRMLTTKDIVAATGLTKSEARGVQEAIARSFLQVPLAVRGLGDRAVDLVYGLRGSAAFERRYLRIQGALRYSWNPFFQYLRLIPKTETLTEFEGGGFIKSVFTGRLKQIGDIRQALRDGGFLDKAGLGGIEGGEGVELGGNVGRNLTHKLLPAQESSIAGLVDAQAQKMGMDWHEYITTFPDHVRDTIQSIAEYDRHSQILNSPLMRTLNIAAFPLRFDTKVATIMARSLGRTSLSTQVGVLKGLYDFHSWINSDQGRAWYAANADAIGLFNYVTPIAHIDEVMESLLPGHDHSLGNFGEVGGLPFGFITQLLDSEGLTHFNQAGADPKSGDLYTQYLPKTAKGQVAILIQDFLSSLFSYPGATVGLPSKTKFTRGVAMGLLGANTSDFTLQQPQPTPDQLSYQQALQRTGVTTATPSAAQTPVIPPLTRRVPALSAPANTPLPPRAPASGSAGKKKKKSEFTPALLPGQTTLGQL